MGFVTLSISFSLFNNDPRLSLAAYNAGENLVLSNRYDPPYQENPWITSGRF